jgi:hypothetical protein
MLTLDLIVHAGTNLSRFNWIRMLNIILEYKFQPVLGL